MRSVPSFTKPPYVAIYKTTSLLLASSYQPSVNVMSLSVAKFSKNTLSVKLLNTASYIILELPV
ncbi:hypothetical protein C2W64_00772 [Brevibacillus laterosporus]|nr:hypothetical protein C2W64_00772 [Brevibacillus laterosporus]